ncbi:MAG: hypothetical protein ABIE92_03305 [bacterium]
MGAGVYASPEGSCSGENNIIHSNNATYLPECYGDVNFDYSCSSIFMPGTGNIVEDPLLVDPGNKDYRLTADSPCIDAGNPASPFDPDNTIADMGAFYFDQGLGVPQNEASVPSAFRFEAYPNPFNPSTTLTFTMPVAGKVALEVFDIRGRNVADVMAGVGAQHAAPLHGGHFYSPGTHAITFDGASLPSGIYFARLLTEDFQQTQKLVLLK